MTHPGPGGQIKRKRLFLYLLALILLAGGGWWWYAGRAATLRETNHFQCYGLIHALSDVYPMTLETEIHDPAAACYVGRTYPIVFAQRDWQGRIRWQVKLPHADKTGWKTYVFRNVALSPNARTLAAITLNGPSIAVTSWRDGKGLGRVDIPIPQGRNCRTLTSAVWRLRVSNTGNIWVYEEYGEETHLYVIRGSSVVAYGKLRSDPRLRRVRRDVHWLLAHDGKTLVASCMESPIAIAYIQLQQHGNTITFHQQYLLLHGAYPITITAKGNVLASKGIVYDATGRSVIAGGKLMIPIREQPLWCMSEINRRHLRISNLELMSQWDIEVPLEYQRGLYNGQVSVDGHYIMFDCLKDRYDGVSREVMDFIGDLPFLDEIKRQNDEAYTITIYKRSGHLAARRVFSEQELVKAGFDETLDFYELRACMSPDGKRVIFTGDIVKGPKTTCYTYTW